MDNADNRVAEIDDALLRIDIDLFVEQPCTPVDKTVCPFAELAGEALTSQDQCEHSDHDQHCSQCDHRHRDGLAIALPRDG